MSTYWWCVHTAGTARAVPIVALGYEQAMTEAHGASIAVFWGSESFLGLYTRAHLRVFVRGL